MKTHKCYTKNCSNIAFEFENVCGCKGFNISPFSFLILCGCLIRTLREDICKRKQETFLFCFVCKPLNKNKLNFLKPNSNTHLLFPIPSDEPTYSSLHPEMEPGFKTPISALSLFESFSLIVLRDYQ